MNICTGCGQEKLPEQFPFRKDRGKRGTRCRECINRSDRARRGCSAARVPAPAPYEDESGRLVKECTKCGEMKPVDQFNWRKQRSQYYAHCKTCHRAIVRSWVSENSEAYREKTRAYYERTKAEDPDRYVNYQLWRAHGITRDDYDRMLAEQGGGCAVCGSDDPKHSDKRATKVRFVVEHDHACCPAGRSCGKCVRGLTCHPCNRLLGQAKDDADILIKAAAYLLSYEFGKEVTPR